jgi:hypothetical protein
MSALHIDDVYLKLIVGEFKQFLAYGLDIVITHSFDLQKREIWWKVATTIEGCERG